MRNIFKAVVSGYFWRLNFENPFYVKEWIKVYGLDTNKRIRLLPNLDINKKTLGFHFKTNKSGFTGADWNDQDKVFCGTSFAMGMAVDANKIWHSINHSACLIRAIPSGLLRLGEILEDLPSREEKTIIILYHPNFKNLTIREQKTRSMDESDLGYVKDYTISNHVKWSLIRLCDFIYGRRLIFKQDGSYYSVNKHYNLNDSEWPEAALESFVNICNSFSKVIIFKYPIKEELLIPEFVGAQYDIDWSYFYDKFSKVKRLQVLNIDLKIDHYHNFDNHWNELGNIAFNDALRHYGIL